jgi:hypothetical protein
VSVRIEDEVETRELVQELEYNQTSLEIVVRTPATISYFVRAFNSSNEGVSSQPYTTRVNRSIRPNPPTNLAADIIANDLPESAKPSGITTEATPATRKPVARNYRYTATAGRDNL